MQNTSSHENAAAVHIRPPKQLVINNHNMATVWKAWIQQFEWYAIATQLYKKDPEIQAATFMAIIGQEAATIFNALNLTEAEQTNLEAIKARFENQFQPKKNIIFERYKFNKIVQHEGETFDEFLTNIKAQSKNCEFATLHDSLLRDRIVIGIRNDKVREKLLCEDDLTLERAIQACRASEQTTKHMEDMKTEESKLVEVVKREEKLFACTRCGTKHGPKKCPAFMKECENCGKKGHFKKMCRTKTGDKTKFQKKEQKVHLTKAEKTKETEESEDEMFVLMVKNKNKNPADWFEIVQHKNNKFKAKLDTGAQCNVMSKTLADKLNMPISPSKVRKIVSYLNNKTDVIGQTNTECTIAGKKKNVSFIIVDEDVTTILGIRTCSELNLIKRIQELKTEENIFKGLGCLKNFEYDIDLKPNATFNIEPARRIPYALKEPVKKELDRMVKMDVIKQITEPTPVVSGMVIVRKNGKIRICIDPSEVNKNLLRRR